MNGTRKEELRQLHGFKKRRLEQCGTFSSGFTHLKVNDGISIRTLRNFSSYGRRSAAAFGPDAKILQQVKRFERAALRELAALKAL